MPCTLFWGEPEDGAQNRDRELCLAVSITQRSHRGRLRNKLLPQRAHLLKWKVFRTFQDDDGGGDALSQGGLEENFNMRLSSCVILLVTAATNPIGSIGCGDYTGDDGGGLDTSKTFEGNAIAAETRLVSQWGMRTHAHTRALVRLLSKLHKKISSSSASTAPLARARVR